MKVILACDESGAKGYADQDEQFAGQVGVFAGLFVPEERLAIAEARLEAAIAPYRTGEGKLHITDLASADQGGLRADIYAAILDLDVPCFWYAIHVAGFHSFHNRFQQVLDKGRQELKASAPNPRIKVGSPRENPDSLHARLFEGLYAHVIAFVEERNPGSIDVEVRTDRVDAPIAKLFREKAENLLDDGPRTYAATGFDTIDKKVVRAEMQTEAMIPAEIKPASVVTSLVITPVGDEDPLVVAADVLANSLCHHFHRRQGDAQYAELNRPSAIIDHPLAQALCSFDNWGGPDISDRMYRHPAAPPFVDE